MYYEIIDAIAKVATITIITQGYIKRIISHKKLKIDHNPYF